MQDFYCNRSKGSEYLFHRCSTVCNVCYRVCPDCLRSRLPGCVLVCRLQSDGFVRRFHAVAEKKTWADARSYCREKFTDLASIGDPSHNAAAQQAAGKGQFWIGLINSDWKWSQQEDVDVDVSMGSIFGIWDLGEPKLNCVTVSAIEIWSTQDCKDHSGSVPSGSHLIF
uniref:C-type lectin domain-containing protein n=1 Tax=Sander lucioperca TaxID=283035 RepID=A0A8C9XUY3_SANLU